MRKHLLVVIFMLISASLAGCTSNEEDETEDPSDITGDDGDDSTEMLNGALFVYIQSGSYAPAVIDENGPLYLHFGAPPMANESPFLLELICSVEEGHVSDVYQTWVNSSGGNAGDFHEITSWSVKNSASPNIQLEMFAYHTMSDIIDFVHPMVVFEDNESITGSGHLTAVVFDQETFSCMDAVTDGTGDGDGDGGEECPFPNEPGDTDSPCFAPECEDEESEACLEFVMEYCEANPDEGGCEMFEFVPIMEFMDALEMDSGMCGTMSEMGTSMRISGLMPSEDGTLVMVNFDRIVEYDGTDTRSMMMYHISNEDAGLSASMGYDTITFTPSESGAYSWFDNMINLHLITSEEDDSGEIISTEYKLILRDNYSEGSDICDEFGSDDDDSGSLSFWCSSTVGGAPDTEIDFALVNDGTEDCGDGSDEPQDFDGDGTEDNWFDCNDDDLSAVPMSVVNDGSYDCPNGADEPDLEVEIDGDMPLPSLDGTACGESDEDDGPMPTSATIEGLDGPLGGIVYVNMTFGDVTDADYCSMEITAFQFSPDSDWIMSSLTATNGTTTIVMENWFEVDLNTVEDADGEWSWGAADLNLMTTNSSIHMFDCGEDGVMGDDGEVEYGSQWIIFKRVNDNIADCADQSDESVDLDGDGDSDVMFHCETPDDASDDINMALVNDGNTGDCPNYSDEYMQTGSSYGTFDWDTTNSILDGFTSSMIITGLSEHDIDASELDLRITNVDSAYDYITEEGHCGEMTNTDKEGLSVLVTIPLDEMDSFAAGFTDSNGKNWNGAWLDNDDNGYVNNGDSITIYSPDSTDLYFTCVELHDNYVDMYTGDTPNMMTLPGFTAVLSLVAVISAFVAITRRD